MPVVDAAIIAACRSEIDSDFGPIPSGLTPTQQAEIDSYRQKLAMVVARSGQYCRDNNQVQAGQTVPPGSFENSAGAVSGTSATSTTTTWL
jgi:hypothetical protein